MQLQNRNVDVKLKVIHESWGNPYWVKIVELKLDLVKILAEFHQLCDNFSPIGVKLIMAYKG